MRMPFSFHARPAALIIAGVLASMIMSGCAYKNPLMSDPAPSASVATQKPAAKPDTSVAAAKPASSTAKDVASGLQVVQEKRRFDFLKPYRPDLQQGNFVSSEMVALLKPGMTPDQVRFILGTPLLADLFHVGRWDYVFEIKKGNGEVTRSGLTVYFRDNRLDKWDGGKLPTEEDYLARIAGQESKSRKASNLVTPARAPSTATTTGQK